MPTEVIMPKVDMDMERGTIIAWHVSEGEQVNAAAPLFDIETDKAAMEVESPASGTLHHIAVGEGEEAEIGHPVAWIYAEGEVVGEAPGKAAGEKAPTVPAAARAADRAAPPTGEESPLIEGESATMATDAGVRATPAARRLAQSFGVDLAALGGTGPRGRIQKRDVEAATRVDALAPVADRAPAAKAESVERLVFVHGFASDAGVWAQLVRRLGRDASADMLELPGHGKTPSEPIASFDELVLTMRRSFDELGLEEVHLVGHSLGAAVALALADQRPRAVRRLTLLAPAGLGPEINRPVIDGILSATQAASLAPWLKELVADRDLLSVSFVDAAAASRADPDVRTAQRAMADILFPDGVQAFDVTQQLNRIAVPTRIVFGKDDGIIPWRHALRAPGRVSLHLFEGMGHLPQVEKLDDVVALIKTRW